MPLTPEQRATLTEEQRNAYDDLIKARHYLVTWESRLNNRDQIEIIESLAESRAECERLKDIIKRSDLEEVDGTTVDSDGCGKPIIKKTGKILVHKDHVESVKEKTSLLQKIANMARYNAKLREALLGVVAAYERNLEKGRDRIIQLGGECDSVKKMMDCNAVREARTALRTEPPK